MGAPLTAPFDEPALPDAAEDDEEDGEVDDGEDETPEPAEDAEGEAPELPDGAELLDAEPLPEEPAHPTSMSNAKATAMMRAILRAFMMETSSFAL